MGMSTHVVGIKPPDETWQKMKAVWDGCEALGIVVPEAVYLYFNGEQPDPDGVLVGVKSNEWVGDGAQGIEVVLADLPEHVAVIRFYNSW